jgi:hypothetical protein
MPVPFLLTQISRGYEDIDRNLSNLALDRILRGSRLKQQDFKKTPVVEEVQLIRCNLQKSTDTTRFRAAKDTAVMFLANGGFRYQMKDVQGPKGRQKPNAGDTFYSLHNIVYWVFRDIASAEKDPKRIMQDETQFTTEMFVVVRNRGLNPPFQ